MSPLLDVRGLTTRFRTPDGVITAVDGVSFSVSRGETVAIVGESGSGKSVTMLSLQRLLPPHAGRIEAGEVWFEGEDLLRASPARMRAINGGRIGKVFQDPMTSLNPVLTIGYQIAEALRAHHGIGRAEARSQAAELLGRVGVARPGDRIDDYPHQFSGGMRQRAMIAMALACEPALLIADEPTTALDVTIQAQIIRLMKRLRAESGMSLIWITHDLGVVARLADRVIVMYAGRIVEEAAVRAFYAGPMHPYSRGLLASLPDATGSAMRRLSPIPGQPPDLARLPAGCAFAPRCPLATGRCRSETPPLDTLDHATGARVACWRAGDPETARAA